MNAALRGNTEAAIVLLDKGANVEAGDEDGLTALMYAVKARRLTTVETLLNRGANVNAQGKHAGYSALVLAVRADDSELIDLLLLYGVDVDSYEARLALGVAQLKGDARMINSLKQAGIEKWP